MTICLLDASGAERWRGQVNSDPGFRLVARDMTLNLAIEVGGEVRLVKIRDGALTAIGRFVPLTEPVDITIKGAGEFWRKLLSPVPPPRFQNLYAAIRAGNCEVIGNGELYAAYFAAITRMIDVLRELENSRMPNR
jgi:hypothetical protein